MSENEGVWLHMFHYIFIIIFMWKEKSKIMEKILNFLYTWFL
jgi:hypothetical protein